MKYFKTIKNCLPRVRLPSTNHCDKLLLFSFCTTPKYVNLSSLTLPSICTIFTTSLQPIPSMYTLTPLSFKLVTLSTPLFTSHRTSSLTTNNFFLTITVRYFSGKIFYDRYLSLFEYICIIIHSVAV